MFLKDKFYKVLSETRTNENSAVFHCALLADCDVYRGHFPHKPVSPGVCNIEMIKECAQMLISETHPDCEVDAIKISTIKQCRLTAVATPQVCPEVDVTITFAQTETGYTIVANIKGEPVQEDGTQTEYMTFKGELDK